MDVAGDLAKQILAMPQSQGSKTLDGMMSSSSTGKRYGKGKSGFLIPIIVAAVIVGGAAAGYAVYQRKKKAKEEAKK